MTVAETRDEANLHKRQKKERKLNLKKEPAPHQCEFFLKRKNRYCAMRKKTGHKFCLDHALFEKVNDECGSEKNDESRVPCPLDPNHTVRQSDLQSHLKKCNARPVETHDPWYSKDINKILLGYETAEIETDKNSTLISETENETLHRLFSILKEYDQKMAPLEKKIYTHAGLDAWFLKKENKKHVTQQASLVGAMKETGLLSGSHFYMEFGCGKAELSRMVNACVVHDTKSEENLKNADLADYGFGLVDRGVNRMKMDNKIVSDCDDSVLKPQIKRSRIDIQHLSLDKFLESVHHGPIVAISKHLCGAATDLTLKLILNSEKTKKQLDGLVVAMCCRHCCDYEQLLPQSQEYLAKRGIFQKDFASLKKIVTWAVCGRSENEDNHASGLTYEEREKMGLVARRLIDESRVEAINALLESHMAELFLYAEKDTTLENHCLRITRR